ncbi:MAG: hypothetical protein SFZ23_01715 [Planctomycetota bacterium]|nr:hypothetical protein [Planctomycetota bacterium]
MSDSAPTPPAGEATAERLPSSAARPARTPRSIKAAAIAGGLVAAFLFALLAMLVRSKYAPMDRGAFDEINFHLPAIRQFSLEWPSFVLTDYLSATTPGYHVALASVLKVAGSLEAVRLSNLGISAAFLFLIAWAAARFRSKPSHPAERERLGPTSDRHDSASTTLSRALLALPLLASMHVLFPGVWLLPDNLAWLLVAAIVLLALHARWSVGVLVAMGFLVCMLVLVRQIHLWTAAVVWAWALFSEPRLVRVLSRASTSHEWMHEELLPTIRSSAGGATLLRLLAAVGITLPAFVLVIAFASVWGGLTPPSFQGQYHAANPAAPAFVLALFGLFSAFFLPITLREFFAPRGASLRWPLARFPWGLALAGGLCGFGLSVVPPTTYSMADGRWSGLWNIAGKLPTIAGHSSLLIVLLAVLGGAAFAFVLSRLCLRRAIVLFVTLAGFVAAQAASFQLWQRYSEPMILMLLAIVTPLTLDAKRTTGRNRPELDDPPSGASASRAAPWLRAFDLAPVLLALLLGAYAFVWLRRAQPADYYAFRVGDERIKAFVRGEPVEPVARGPVAPDVYWKPVDIAP